MNQLNLPAKMANRKSWLKLRKEGVGSSDAASILGCGFLTPQEVWEDKVNSEVVEKHSDRMELGTYLEPYISARYEAETGRMLLDQTLRIMRRPERPWQMASLDRLCLEPRRIVELKAVFSPPGGEWGEAGSDRIPASYLIQVQHQMGVAGIYDCDVAACFVGYGLRIYSIPFDLVLFDWITQAEAEFWAYVERREPLPPDWQAPLADKISNRASRIVPGSVIEFGEGEAHLANQYREYKRIAKEAADSADGIKQTLLERMGEAELGLLPDGGRITRKSVERKSYTVDATTYTDFRIYGPRRKN